MNNIGNTVRVLRQLHGCLSQRQAAKRLGISTVHLCNIEKGHSQPSWKLLDKIETIYGVSFVVGVSFGFRGKEAACDEVVIREAKSEGNER